MKITIEIPDWAEERHIRIFAGVELLGEKLAHEDFLKIKVDRCNRCGECCKVVVPEGYDPDTFWLYDIVDGACEHLEPEPGRPDKYRCKIFLNCARGCTMDPLREMKNGKCCISYKQIPIE